MPVEHLFRDLPEEDREAALNLLRLQLARRRRRAAVRPDDAPQTPPPLTERTEKRCPRCDTVKPVTAFGVSRTRPDGRQGFCRLCRRRV